MIQPRQSALSLILLVFLFSSVFSQKIDVLSYNIRFASLDDSPHNWNSRKDGVCRLLKAYDFIGLQEVLPVQMDDIKLKLGAEYNILFRSREADPEIGEGSPVLYNKNRWEVIRSGFFWLSDTPEIPGSNTWGAACNRMVSFGFFRNIISGDSILVMNTHFDHISQTARETSISLILKKFGKKIGEMPVILMGDFNANPENPVYRKILSESALKDSWAEMHKSELSSGPTFHGWLNEKPDQRIDFIFFSPGLKLEKSMVLHNKFKGEYPSDHFPVKSVFTF